MTFKQFMERAGLNRSQVARKAKVPFNTVRRFLEGENRVGFSALRSLSRLTRGLITVEQLARENDQRFTARKARAPSTQVEAGQ